MQMQALSKQKQRQRIEFLGQFIVKLINQGRLNEKINQRRNDHESSMIFS